MSEEIVNFGRDHRQTKYNTSNDIAMNGPIANATFKGYLQNIEGAIIGELHFRTNIGGGIHQSREGPFPDRFEFPAESHCQQKRLRTTVDASLG